MRLALIGALLFGCAGQIHSEDASSEACDPESEDRPELCHWRADFEACELTRDGCG